MDSRLLKDIATWVAIGLGIVFLTTGISEWIFGDLTERDSLLPLFVIVPILVIASIVFRHFWIKGNKK